MLAYIITTASSVLIAAGILLQLGMSAHLGVGLARGWVRRRRRSTRHDSAVPATPAALTRRHRRRDYRAALRSAQGAIKVS
jgi:hypothetical protein